jgi:hypothetical protein
MVGLRLALCQKPLRILGSRWSSPGIERVRTGAGQPECITSNTQRVLKYRNTASTGTIFGPPRYKNRRRRGTDAPVRCASATGVHRTSLPAVLLADLFHPGFRASAVPGRVGTAIRGGVQIVSGLGGGRCGEPEDAGLRERQSLSAMPQHKVLRQPEEQPAEIAFVGSLGRGDFQVSGQNVVIAREDPKKGPRESMHQS